MRGALNGVYAPGKQLACQRYASVLPLSHVFGLIRGTLSVLYEGGTWYAAANTKETISKLPVFKPTCLVADVNATLPTTHRISKLTVRKEDFKRTGAMKVSRN